jgi:outer membrane cobalamin receptor
VSRLTVWCFLAVMSLLVATSFAAALPTVPAASVPTTTQTSINQPFASITVVTAQQIIDNDLRSLADVLRLVPGVFVQQLGEFGSPAFARIRGIGDNQILVLVNGERVTNPSFGLGADLSSFTTEDISRIEVARGSLSSQYGANAMGGIINIVTDQNEIDTGGWAELGAGSDGRQARSLLLHGAGKAPWRVGVISPKYEGSQSNSRFGATRILANVAPALGDWKVTVRAHHFQDRADLVRWVYNPFAGNNLGWVRDTNDRQSSERTNYSISLSRPTANKGGFGLNSYIIEQQLEQQLSTGIIITNPAVTGTTKATDFNWNYSINDHNFFFGGEVREEKYDYDDSETLISQRKKITDKGLFLEDRWVADPMTAVTAGARFDDHSIAGNILSPRVGVIHFLPKGLKLRATYAEGFRSPGFMELYDPNSGNADLDAEKSRQYELAVSRTGKTDSLEVIFFQYDIRDFIALSEDDVPQYGNIASTRQRGAELIWQQQLSPKFSYATSYTFLDAKDRSSGERLCGVPRHLAALTTRYEIGKNWQALLSGWYNGGFDGADDLQVPVRVVVDASVVGTFGKYFHPYLTIRNLTNAPLQQEANHFESSGIKYEAGIRTIW